MRDLWKSNGVQKLWIQGYLLNFSCAMEEALLWQLLHYVPARHFQLINISCKLEIYDVSIAKRASSDVVYISYAQFEFAQFLNDVLIQVQRV